MRAVLCLAVLLASFASHAEGMYDMSLGDQVVSVELADTEASRERGLMYRRSLCANCGMLFIFPYEERWSFWSKNTPLALSVAFIDRNRRVIAISDMEAESLNIHTSPKNVFCALEMPRGWFSSHGIKIGDRFSNAPGSRSLPGALLQRCGWKSNKGS